MAQMYMEPFMERMRARFGGKEKVYFHVTQELVASDERIEKVTMFNSEGTQLAQMVFKSRPDNKAEVQSFNVESWDTKKGYGQRLLKWFIYFAKSRKMESIECEIFKSDDKTFEKLDVFKESGFNTKDMGGLGGTVQYQLEYRLVPEEREEVEE